MYCGECGTKNEKDAKFCENCGAALEQEEEKKEGKREKKPAAKARKPISKSKKILIGVICAVVVLLIVGFLVLKNSVSPNAVANAYFKAFADQDLDTMYQYSDLDDSEFTTKDRFIEYYSNDDQASLAKSIKNFNITDVEYSKNSLTAEVDISYTTSRGSKRMTLELHKTTDKKYLVFDEWKVVLPEEDFTEDFTLYVPEGSEVNFGGVTLDESYLDETSDGYDSYVIPALFNMDYEVTVTLPVGFEITETVSADNYNNPTWIDFDEDSLSDEDFNTIKKQIKADMNLLYSSAIGQQDWSSISDNFGKDASDLEDAYDDLKNDVSGGYFSSALSSFEATDIRSIDSIYFEDGIMEVDFTVDYKYTPVDGDEKTNYDFVWFYYEMDGDQLKLVDAYSLPSYF